jgi:HlyD family secretion protein
VLVVGSDGAAHKHAVKVGLRTTERVQILSGVTSSDMVVTEGGYGLDDGTKVTVGVKDKDDDKGGAADDKGSGK